MAEPVVLREGGSAIIAVPDQVAALGPEYFDPDHWRREGARPLGSTGRGVVLTRAHGGEEWVLRHYQRGGFVSKLVYDHYVWLGSERTRPFREFRLLATLHAEGYPVPRPIAARAVVGGLWYQADIVMELLGDTRTLSALLAEGRPDDCVWHEIGGLVRRLHERGVDHPDLTAHNLLVDSAGGVHVVDFDNARLRPGNRWQRSALQRLQRSLRKVALETGATYDVSGWNALLRGYGRGTDGDA